MLKLKLRHHTRKQMTVNAQELQWQALHLHLLLKTTIIIMPVPTNALLKMAAPPLSLIRSQILANSIKMIVPAKSRKVLKSTTSMLISSKVGLLNGRLLIQQELLRVVLYQEID